MADNLNHNSEDLGILISELREVLASYKVNIGKLENLVSSINASPAWKDESVKTSFIQTATSYISGYKMVAQGVESYITFLVSKSSDFDNLESRFS